MKHTHQRFASSLLAPPSHRKMRFQATAGRGVTSCHLNSGPHPSLPLLFASTPPPLGRGLHSRFQGSGRGRRPARSAAPSPVGAARAPVVAGARDPWSCSLPAAAGAAAAQPARQVAAGADKRLGAGAAPPRRGDAMAAAEPASSGQQAPQGQGQGQRPQPQPSQAQPPQQPPPPQLGGGGGGSSRHEKSLGLLTTKFVSLLQEAKDGVLDLKAVRAGGGDGGGLRCPRPPKKPTLLKRGSGGVVWTRPAGTGRPQS